MEYHQIVTSKYKNTIGKGQRPVLKGEPLGEEEPDLFVSVFMSSISVLGFAFPTNTKNRVNLIIAHKIQQLNS